MRLVFSYMILYIYYICIIYYLLYIMKKGFLLKLLIIYWSYMLLYEIFSNVVLLRSNFFDRRFSLVYILNQDQDQNYFSKCNSKISFLVNVERNFKMLRTYYLNFNCSKFPKKAHDLEIIKKSMKKSVKHGKTRTKQVTLTHERRNSEDTRGT